MGAVVLLEPGCAVDHAAQGPVLVGKRGDPEADGALAGEAGLDAQSADEAQVTRQRGREDGDDAEALTQGHGGQYAGFGDTEHRLGGGLAGGMKAGVGEAGDDETVGPAVLSGDQAAQRLNHAVHMGLGFDAGRPLGQGPAFDLGPAGQAQAIQRPIDVFRASGR